MPSSQGRFIWHELLSADAASVSKFYAEIVGWSLDELTADGVAYTILKAGEQPIAAVTDASSGAPANRVLKGWIGYAAVDDVDAVASNIVRLGGTLPEEALQKTQIGRVAVAHDPQGAHFGLFTPDPGNANPERGNAGDLGKVTWHELYVDDPGAAFAFYANLFGWERDVAFDMGPAGPYQLFALGGEQIGGMMRRPPQLPKAYWNTFFEVDDITSAERRVTAAGGTVFDGPRQIPSGGFTLKCFDPEGAMFALSGPKC